MKVGKGRILQLEFRAYNEGAAFRYILPEQPHLGPSVVITGECSQFNLPQGCIAYEHRGAEGEYHPVAVSELKPDCERPLTVVFPDGTYAAITEAGLVDHPRMLLAPDIEQRCAAQPA
ncbi:glycoside hydrolase family 97 N-terminal domain-containing protein [Paenibacillus sp. sptzw28]|nr:glycoside hydrolase family 97 N-terminal domain-containing protein [Paenibacillus sp. sptzw28]